jgi:hypothetical protein
VAVIAVERPPAAPHPEPPVAAPPAPRPAISGGDAWMYVLVMAYALIISTYFVARFERYWAENDTGDLSVAIRETILDEALIPEGDVYTNGYGYPVVGATLVAFTGLSIADLQQIAMTMTSAMLVIPAWALYRELTGSARAAGLAVLLLFVQPEFLFVILRGSHERFTRLMMLVAIWLLVRMFRHARSPRQAVVTVLMFDVVAYGLISMNGLFGTSFTAALALAMVAAWVLGRLRPNVLSGARPIAARLTWVCLSMALVGYLYIFYIYPPASGGVSLLGSISQRLLAVTTTTGETSTVAYRQVAGAWIDLRIYFLLSSGTYILMLGSALVWAGLGLRMLFGRGQPPTLERTLLWLLYAAFAVQGAVAVAGDLSGASVTNLQVRAFPSFAMVGTPLLASVLASRPWRPYLAVPVAMLIGLMATAAVLKATNEPLLSNKWTFYDPNEVAALRWADEHLRLAFVWAGLDERVVAAYVTVDGATPNKNTWVQFAQSDLVRTYVISDIMRLQAERTNLAIPEMTLQHRVFDAGGAQVYHRRPSTPYQR